ncbi:MAG: acyl-CoA dehydrogenase family protein [Deltaproteobacteria bacterium]|nr:acyl-CoA dehydrogenase family protein [Deltaproteobacteria bacterium]MBW2047523.1 acyl-CoA dehydrogenase family protein [Deltaproteobacteria bacterium]MBW2111467.1 acyl-CoA dehydrogenase family protein [Deltaproteobacteria bacterium]MBW2352114.1 acyl-CoA dehydrogenase family protein [Deltaproteobacteria bacterium]HDZ90018.1 acyl-CoA dehydrogenase [Deltaproteobacteria bacterium]
MTQQTGMDPEILSMVLDTIDKLERERLPLEIKLEMDRAGDFPSDLIRFMLGPDIALHLIFIPEQYGGLGAGATEIAVVSERMAKMDLAIATSFLAICLGMDPIRVGATPEQREKYITKIAEQGLVVAYGVTEPEAGSNVQSLKTRAERVLDEGGNITGYRINGQKQFITNGGVADLYTILADTPDGPSFFIVEAGAQGLVPGKHEDKHGIRASDTCPLSLEDLFVPVEDLVGGVEGQGLKQANKVFGYTRLMVATFGLGGGMASLERTVKYSKERVQFGTTLAEKQGYTHRLLVPHAVQLEAARAYIEEVARRLDTDEEDLQVEGSIAKYFATEAGDAMANDAIQAFGGYGYIREFEVEKIKRDVKILTIYEGTSEIQRNIISMFRMRSTVRSKGGFYQEMADRLASLSEETGGPLLARAILVMNEVILSARKKKLTKSQHVMFLLADMMTWAETAGALCHKGAVYTGGQARTPSYMRAAARLFAREAVEKIYLNGIRILQGCAERDEQAGETVRSLDLGEVVRGSLQDMDIVARELVS